jgi:Mg-chelatase subunit ChlD
MRPRNRTIDIFNISMLDVLSGALGAFLLIMLVLMRFHEPRVTEENTRLREELAQTRAKAATADARIAEQAAALREAQQRAQAAEAQSSEATARVQNLEQRLGIALKETEIVFVLDVSGSMRLNNPDKEDRMTQVVSGIKMLVAMMSSAYSIDVVYFPGPNGPYGTLYGRLQPVTEGLKNDVYRRLQALSVGGGTPTGDAMRAVLGPQYAAARTVVLLSDGEPCRTVGDSCVALTRAEMAQLVEQLTQANNGQKTINAIGVGTSFRNEQASAADAVTFLRSLAQRNGGFYIGF